MMMMAYTVVNGSLRHENKLYEEGATLPSLGAEAAAILLELGVIVETQPAAKGRQKDD